jgi:hypothetical protein
MDVTEIRSVLKRLLQDNFESKDILMVKRLL